MQQYEQQKNRGTEGFGLYDRTRDHLVRSTTEKGIKRWLTHRKTTSVMFHHRFPTSTDNVKNACHPFSTGDYFATNYVLIHNGWVSNAYELATEHEKLGIEYHSIQDDGRFNDSEALLWDVALYLEGKQDSLRAEGPIAFVCMATPKDGRKSSHLYFARNTNPLNMQYTEDFLFLSSEGEGEPVLAHTLYDYNYRTKKLEYNPLTVPERVVLQTYSSPGYSSPGHTSALGRGWDDDDELEMLGSGSSGKLAKSYYRYKVLVNMNPRYVDYMENDNPIYRWVGNQSINVSEKVRNRVQLFLKEAWGLYEFAADMADDTYLDTIAQIEQDRACGFIEDPDLLLEADILCATLDVLYSSPYWVGRNAVDPSFEGLQQPLTA